MLNNNLKIFTKKVKSKFQFDCDVKKLNWFVEVFLKSILNLII